jgi:small GTP-binding protein
MGINKKICILGEFAVGKTSLVRRHVHDIFSEEYKATLGVNIYKYCDAEAVVVDGTPVSVDEVIWDIEGSMGSAETLKSYILGAAGAVIIADITRPESIEKMPDYAATFLATQVGRPIVFALNKADLVGEAERGSAALAAHKENLGGPVFATSAATGDTVKEMFHGLAGEILRLGT